MDFVEDYTSLRILTPDDNKTDRADKLYRKHQHFMMCLLANICIITIVCIIGLLALDALQGS